MQSPWWQQLWNTPDGLARLFYATQWATAILALLTALAIILSVVINRRRDALLVVEQVTASQKQNQQLSQMKAQVEKANKSTEEARAAQSTSESKIAELEAARAPRRLTAEQASLLTRLLSSSPQSAVTIKASMSADDARAYAEQLAGALGQAGWPVKIDAAMFSGINVNGVWITVSSGQVWPAGTNNLADALKKVGIKTEVRIDAGADSIWLCIGHK